MSNREIEYEVDGYIEDNAVDTVWVRDGRGKMIKLEVDDDVDDN